MCILNTLTYIFDAYPLDARIIEAQNLFHVWFLARLNCWIFIMSRNALRQIQEPQRAGGLVSVPS